MTFAATIIIPVLRQEDAWLEQCVRSALTQSVPSEVIVVTASKTPASNLTLLQSLAREAGCLRLLPEEAPGFASAFNTGIRAATTDRIGFLLSDDWLDPHALEECLPRNADIVSTQVSNYDADGVTPLQIERRIAQGRFDRLSTFQEKASYLSHFYLFRRQVLLDVGGVDETIGNTGPDDYDLIWTLLENEASVSIVEKVLYFKRDHHGERLTLRDRQAQIEDVKKIFDKHGVHGPLREKLIAGHARWYGRPIHVVVQEQRKTR